jgi:membrane peptidoglycan carboxypeptidase
MGPGGPGGPPPPMNRGGRPGPNGPMGPGGRPPGGLNAPTQRTPFNQPTDMLPPVHEEYQREPELMTHREHDLPPEPHYIEPDEYLEDEYDEATLRKKRIWRRVRRGAYVLAAVGFVGPVVAFIITYFMVEPPSPQQVLNQQQTMTIYYADGSVMATLGPKTGGDRTVLPIDKIPPIVQHAVEAAEDETFETNSGFDIKGIGRAVYNQLKGNGGGGSGITQQYVKKATGNEDHTLTRKWTELVKAIKMSQQQTKPEILAAYLNTVYFGRGAYGIQAASQAYFGKNVGDLDPSQAAFLAGCINVPGNNEDPSWTNQRWSYTMGRMVANGWISAADRAKYPTQPTPKQNESDGGALDGPTTFLVRQIKREASLPDFAGLDDTQLAQMGAQIHTTIDKKAMDQAVSANQAVIAKDTPYNPNIASAQVSIDPKTGGIIAWYGGPDAKTWTYDMADTPNQPGSSFKPFVFMAGMLENPKIGLNSLYDGEPNQTIGGQHVTNADEESCGKSCTVKQAMTLSVNTVFYKMTDDIGASNVRNAALAAGINPIQRVNGTDQPALKLADGSGPNDGIALGAYEVRPRDMAQGYATLANNGMYIPSHFITSIKDSTGGTPYDAAANPKLTPVQAFDKTNSVRNAQLARNVTQSMLDVAASSCADTAKTQCASLRDKRPVAAKTGTAQFGNTGTNANAWMVGYTPQVVTAVWVGNRNAPGTIKGYYLNHIGPSQKYDIYGREEPSYIWKAFMSDYLTGKPVEQFPTFRDLGGSGNFSGYTTTTTPTQTTTTGSSTTTDTTNPDDTTTTTKTRGGGGNTCQPLGICPPTDTSTTTKSHGPGGGTGDPGVGGG